MPVTIKIPVRTHENFGDSIAKLIKTVEEITSSPDRTIILDFSQATMLNPFFLGGLVCTIKHFTKLGYKFVLNHDTNFKISSYLNTIFFPESFKAEPGNERQFLSTLDAYKGKTYIPIVSFKTGESIATTQVRENVLNALSNLMRIQLKFSEIQKATPFLLSR